MGEATEMLPVPLKTLLAVPRNERRVMTRGESEALIHVTLAMDMMDIKPVPVMQLGEHLSGHFAAQVFVKRLQAANAIAGLDPARPEIGVSPGVSMFLIYMSSSPAHLVLWAHTVFVQTVLQGRAYEVDDLVRDFPEGFPTEAGYNALWDAQKGSGAVSDNRIDNFSEWDRTLSAERQAAGGQRHVGVAAHG